MLRVPTYVAPSRISGMGLFSATHLPAGTRIWEFTEGVDWRIPPEDLAYFPEPFQARMRHYLYKDGDGLYVLCGDNGKFMNHAEDPNCSDANPAFTVTLRDILPGEELTCDYREFDEDSKANGLTFAGKPHFGEAARPR